MTDKILNLLVSKITETNLAALDEILAIAKKPRNFMLAASRASHVANVIVNDVYEIGLTLPQDQRAVPAKDPWLEISSMSPSCVDK